MTARCRVVSARTPIGESPGNGSHSTLGELLYTDKAKSRVSEDEWIGIVQAIAAGDQSALRALYERTHRLVFTLTMRISGNRATAEELTLDVFHDVWRRASQYDPANGSVIGWIMNQARSRAIDRLRFAQRQKRTDPGTENPQSVTAADDSENIVEARERSRVLTHALALLSPEERRAIETAFFFEASYTEVAARLNQPLGTIKTRIRSGLMKLRRALSAAGEGA
jgi:RNA polymerase sigma-70 factor (ECF subfamily)